MRLFLNSNLQLSIFLWFPFNKTSGTLRFLYFLGFVYVDDLKGYENESLKADF